ncbi:MAG TPA: pitrilysin family protein [Planctomycetota bacterium]|nr:pitrilysin family protein [Planctomycetota bacterium]
MKPAPSTRVFPYEARTSTLDNGLKVVLIPMPSQGLSAYWTIVRTGSRDEVEPGVTGFAHFFEHMMFRGTETLPGPEYDRIVNGLGADANAYTTDDYTAYHLGFATADLPTVARIEADRFRNLSYDESQFKTESGAVYGEYRKGRTSPFDVLFEALQNAAFDVHTYKHTTIGFEADIAAMPQQYDYSQGFFRRFYRPENTVVVVAGDFDPAATLALIRKEYGGWEPGYQAPAVPAEPEQTAQRRIDVPFEGRTLPILCVAFKGERLLPDDRRMLAGSLIGELAFGETSPLYKKLVLDEQRVDSMFQLFGYNRDPGLWGVIALVKDPADVTAVEGEIWSAVDALRRAPPGQRQLDDVRSRLKYGFLTQLSTPSEVCQNLAQLVALGGGVEIVDQLYATLDSVTPQDVQAAAVAWLTPERSTVAVLHAQDEPLPSPSSATPPVLLPVAQDPNVAFKVWFRVGSQDDPPGKEGLAALTGALVSAGGTQARSYDELLAALYPLAAEYGASIDTEMTVVSGLTHRDNVGAFYPVFLEVLLTPGFRQDDFERLRDNAINAIEKELRYSSDEELGKATLQAAAFAGTRYAHLDRGSVEALRAITLQDVKDFWAAHYTAENAVIGLGGSYDEALPARLLADLARLPSGTPPATPAPQPPPHSGRHVTIVQKPGDSTAISFGAPIDVRRGSREWYALAIANSWLGEHRNSSSHLYQVIREARGMNYGDYSYIEAYPNGGRRSLPPTGVGRRQHLFEVWIRPVKEPQALFALRAALREVERLHESGLTQEQFDFTRNFLKKYTLHYAETTEDRLGYALDDLYYGLPAPGHLETYRRMLDSVTLEEVNAAIRKSMQADDLRIAIVTEHAAELAAAIAADAPSPIDYGELTKPAEILAEDELIASWPLKVPAANVTVVPVDEMFQK